MSFARNRGVSLFSGIVDQTSTALDYKTNFEQRIGSFADYDVYPDQSNNIILMLQNAIKIKDEKLRNIGTKLTELKIQMKYMRENATTEETTLLEEIKNYQEREYYLQELIRKMQTYGKELKQKVSEEEEEETPATPAQRANHRLLFDHHVPLRNNKPQIPQIPQTMVFHSPIRYIHPANQAKKQFAGLRGNLFQNSTRGRTRGRSFMRFSY